MTHEIIFFYNRVIGFVISVVINIEITFNQLFLGELVKDWGKRLLGIEENVVYLEVEKFRVFRERLGGLRREFRVGAVVGSSGAVTGGMR